MLLKVAGWAMVASVFYAEPWYIGAIFGLFLIGAAGTKDFADIEGDRAGGCKTLPILYGVKKAAWIIAPFFVFPWLLIPLGARAGVASAHYRSPGRAQPPRRRAEDPPRVAGGRGRISSAAANPGGACRRGATAGVPGAPAPEGRGSVVRCPAATPRNPGPPAKPAAWIGPSIPRGARPGDEKPRGRRSESSLSYRLRRQ
jgi:hypothetical protein